MQLGIHCIRWQFFEDMGAQSTFNPEHNRPGESWDMYHGDGRELAHGLLQLFQVNGRKHDAALLCNGSKVQ